MLNIRGEKIFTQTELMDNLVAYIDDAVAENVRELYINTIAAGIGGVINESEHYVQGYLKKALRLER